MRFFGFFCLGEELVDDGPTAFGVFADEFLVAFADQALFLEFAEEQLDAAFAFLDFVGHGGDAGPCHTFVVGVVGEHDEEELGGAVASQACFLGLGHEFDAHDVIS